MGIGLTTFALLPPALDQGKISKKDAEHDSISEQLICRTLLFQTVNIGISPKCFDLPSNTSHHYSVVWWDGICTSMATSVLTRQNLTLVSLSSHRDSATAERERRQKALLVKVTVVIATDLAGLLE